MVSQDDPRQVDPGSALYPLPQSPAGEVGLEEAQAEVDCDAGSGDVPCEFLCGSAGCGKTFEIKRRIEADPTYGILSASTGIAAVNLSAVTINSLLGYFDTDSLRDNYLTGRLTTALHKLALEYRWLVIDEVSMIDGLQLDLIYRALQQANDYADIKSPMGIVLVGDFAQLPPVKARFAFEAECWPEFDAHTTRLTRIWRQDQQEFLQALNFARRGQGAQAAEVLSSVGVRWETALDTDYDGTTLVPKNDQVDRFNQLKLDGHRGAKFPVSNRRWGQQRSEWKGIPFNLTLKEGCYVMILSNAKIDEETGKFPWVNGDCGYVETLDTDGLAIRLVRTGDIVHVPKLTRSVAVKDKPERWDSTLRQDGWHAGEHRDGRGRYVIGQVEYWPVRLAYASTVHKSQGLSLDKLQVDIRNSFFSHPGMLYVALSRCRTLEGLRIVGQRERFVMHCKADERIQRWL
jgi:ATP-dependent DNA helicase PIF1